MKELGYGDNEKPPREGIDKGKKPKPQNDKTADLAEDALKDLLGKDDEIETELKKDSSEEKGTKRNRPEISSADEESKAKLKKECDEMNDYVEKKVKPL